ncbi:MAG: ATP-binding cassette domain-containing protein [Bacteriovoracaceae bacterium]|nr:ATP-binding cassette domain-containing protein [Bacteriovoracaceae bacterium]
MKQERYINHKVVFKLFISMIAQERNLLRNILGYALIAGFLSLVVPVAAQAVINHIAFVAQLWPLLVLSSIVFFTLLFSGLTHLLQMYFIELMEQRLFVKTMLNFGITIPRISQDIFYDKSSKVLVPKLLEVLFLQKSFRSLLLEGIAVLLQTFIGLVLLAFYHPVFLAFDLILILGIFLTLVVFFKKGITSSIEESYAKYGVIEKFESIRRNDLVFRSEQGRNWIFNKIDTSVLEYLKKRKAHFRVILKQTVLSVSIQVCMLSSLLGIGGWLVIKGHINIGQLVAAEIVVGLISVGLLKLGKHLESYYDLIASTQKLWEVVDLPEEKTGDEKLFLEKEVNIRIKDLCLKYSDGTVIFDQASLNLNSGVIYAITGIEGSGKSSLADVLYGLQRPNAGILQINNQDYRNLDLGTLRNNIVLLRSLDILPVSVKENLTINTNYTEKEIQEVLDVLDFSDEILSLENGIHTHLKAFGNPLTFSSAWKLIFARSLLMKPKVWIMDGVLDYVEEKIRKALLDEILKKDPHAIVIILTRDVDVMAFAHQIYKVKDSKILVGI